VLRASASRRRGSICSCSENIDVCEHHLEEVARDNSLRRGDSRWRGHHSVDPSERRTERTFGSTGPGRAQFERTGVNLHHVGHENRFENDSVLLAMAGILFMHIHIVIFCYNRGIACFRVKLHWNPASYDQDRLCEIS